MQVVGIGALDLHRGDLADAQRTTARDIDRAIDLRRVALAAAFCNGWTDLVDNHAFTAADFALEALLRDCLLARHQPVPAFLFRFGGDGRGKIVGRGASYRLVAEKADAIELALTPPIEQEGKIVVGLAGEADNEG